MHSFFASASKRQEVEEEEKLIVRLLVSFQELNYTIKALWSSFFFILLQLVEQHLNGNVKEQGKNVFPLSEQKQQSVLFSSWVTEA